MSKLIQYGNYAAKALVPWVVLLGAYLTDLATQWTDVAGDGTVDVLEWQTFILTAVASLGIFLKRNGEKPA